MEKVAQNAHKYTATKSAFNLNMAATTTKCICLNNFAFQAKQKYRINFKSENKIHSFIFQELNKTVSSLFLYHLRAQACNMYVFTCANAVTLGKYLHLY